MASREPVGEQGSAPTKGNRATWHRGAREGQTGGVNDVLLELLRHKTWARRIEGDGAGGEQPA